MLKRKEKENVKILYYLEKISSNSYKLINSIYIMYVDDTNIIAEI